MSFLFLLLIFLYLPPFCILFLPFHPIFLHISTLSLFHSSPYLPISPYFHFSSPLPFFNHHYSSLRISPFYLIFLPLSPYFPPFAYLIFFSLLLHPIFIFSPPYPFSIITLSSFSYLSFFLSLSPYFHSSSYLISLSLLTLFTFFTNSPSHPFSIPILLGLPPPLLRPISSSSSSLCHPPPPPLHPISLPLFTRSPLPWLFFLPVSPCFPFFFPLTPPFHPNPHALLTLLHPVSSFLNAITLLLILFLPFLFFPFSYFCHPISISSSTSPFF